MKNWKHGSLIYRYIVFFLLLYFTVSPQNAFRWLYLSTAIIYRVGGYQGGMDVTEDQGAKDYREGWRAPPWTSAKMDYIIGNRVTEQSLCGTPPFNWTEE